MDRRKFWTLAAGLPAVVVGAAVAAPSVYGGTGAPQAACCEPGCCPPGCCDEGAAAKPAESEGDCCTTTCCAPAKK